jgi:hypothetical protein
VRKGVGDEGGLVFACKGCDVAFDGGGRSARSGCAAGGKKNAQANMSLVSLVCKGSSMNWVKRLRIDYSMEGIWEKLIYTTTY